MLRAIAEEHALGNIPTPDATVLSEWIDEADLEEGTPSARRAKYWRRFVAARRRTMAGKVEGA